MKAEELRIGNIVGDYNGDDSKWFKVTPTNIKVEQKANKQDFNRYRPIPISEEWLLKLGFTHNRMDNLLWKSMPFNIGEIHYEKKSYGNVFVLYGSSSSVFVPNDIEYVHQLQNLYHSLTGKELEITSLKKKQ